MNKLTKIIISLLGVIALIVIIGPGISGIFFQKAYQQLFNFYNARGNVHVEMIHYQRHWFSTDANMSVEVIHPEILNGWGMNNFSHKKYFINQHIQHGPIFYQNIGHPFSNLFGVALIQSDWLITPEIKNALKLLGINNIVLKQYDTILSFSGNYLTHIIISALDTVFPKNLFHLKFNNLEGYFSIHPATLHIQGKIILEELNLSNPIYSITIPHATLQFDQQQSDHHLWLGKTTFITPQITWHDVSQNQFIFSSVTYISHDQEVAGEVSGNREIQIKNLKLNDQSMGPLQLTMSANNLNASAIIDFINSSRIILQRGELYQSQLQENFFLLLPNMINQASTVKLEQFNFNTPDGNLNFTGDAYWKTNDNSTPENIVDLIQMVNGQFDLHISKKLTDKLIRLLGILIPTIKDDLHPQLNEWISAGYIKDDNNNYLVSVTKQQGTYKINGQTP